MINPYPSIYNLGHNALRDLFNGSVIVEEKVDGSQISFGVKNGELEMKSRGAPINIVAPEGMFAKAVEVVSAIKDKLHEGWIYRGEYLQKPKHNCLAYDRTPSNNIIIFDIQIGDETYAYPANKRVIAEALGFECVPVLYTGMVDSPEALRAMFDTVSILGGQKIEGVVIKPLNYDLFGRDKKVVMGKFVCEAFKEIHGATWSKEHKQPYQNEILHLLASALTTEGRWAKAVQHLTEAGLIKDEPQDIGLLMKEVPEDIQKECEQYIKDKLFHWAWPQLKRMVTRGLPEWYKAQLLRKQFETIDVSQNRPV